jgi:hypothetical protein
MSKLTWCDRQAPPAFCRRCTDQLLQAAAAAGGDGGGAQPQDASAAAALRCSRCMALMLQVVKQGQVCTRHSHSKQSVSAASCWTLITLLFAPQVETTTSLLDPTIID